MADNFPDLPSKLGAPSKKSLFERQKAEAEAKKARERAETAAVYEDFVKSFDEDGDTGRSHTPARAPPAGGVGHGSAPGKRHFTTSGLKSGPGSLGLVSGSQSRKRYHEGLQSGGRDRNHGVLSFDDERRLQEQSRDRSSPGAGYEDSGDKDAARPTLHLSSLPPGTSPSLIRALLTPTPLTVEDVRILPPTTSSASSTERKATSAIVTLAPETSSTDIETVVSHLQNRYLGFGYRLSISRHLSSAALTGSHAISAPSTNLNNLPFGARPIPQNVSLSRAPPPGHNRVPPPSSYTSSTPYSNRDNLPPTQVTVQIPSDLTLLKLVHKTLEALLSHGPEFEALLMSRPKIQRDEKWAWLWDSRSVGGVYYRWRLWDVLTNGLERRKGRTSTRQHEGRETLFEGQSAWQLDDGGLKFEFTSNLDEFVSDDDYDSSDEEADYAGGIAKRHNDHNTTGAPPAELTDTSEGLGYLNPLAKAKLVHLLARLPQTNAKLRRGDVARLTGFAIEHAGGGAEEVAQLVTRNVISPFSFALSRDQGIAEPNSDDEPGKADGRLEESSNTLDKSAASLVGLYAVSDIFSAAANAGVRHAWRYRSLFETALRQQKVFSKLGRVDRDLKWGKLKAEKWKRSVQNVLSLWEGWCVFPQASQNELLNDFVNSPLNEEEKQATGMEKERPESELQRTKASSKWKSVTEDQSAANSEDVIMDDVDGVAMTEDEIDDNTMAEEDLIDEDLDGMPMMNSSDEEVEEQDLDAPSPDDEPTEAKAVGIANEVPQATAASRRQRMRALDMFADDSDR